MKNKIKTVAFVVTCKGRLHHLKEALPLIMAQNPDEMIVVDYGCPDGTKDWVEGNFPDAKLVYVDDDTGFSVSRARNFGAAHAVAEFICFIDADVKVGAGFVDWLKKNLDEEYYYLIDLKSRTSLTGTVVCAKEAFAKIGGYDEAYRGWGGEDLDLYHMLDFSGYKENHFSSKFLSSIDHGDEDRVVFYDEKNKETSNQINLTYMRVKLLLLNKGKVLSDKECLSLREQVGVHAVDENGSLKKFSILISYVNDFEKIIKYKLTNRRRYFVCGPREIQIQQI